MSVEEILIRQLLYISSYSRQLSGCGGKSSCTCVKVDGHMAGDLCLRPLGPLGSGSGTLGPKGTGTPLMTSRLSGRLCQTALETSKARRPLGKITRHVEPA